MIKCKWVAYGSEMVLDYVIVETKGETIKESHDKAIEKLKKNRIYFDTVEMVNTDFLRNSGILKEEALDDLLRLRNESSKITIRELEIMKAALEGDINYQRDNHNRNKPEFKEWLADTEKLLKKVSRKLFDEKAKESEQ